MMMILISTLSRGLFFRDPRLARPGAPRENAPRLHGADSFFLARYEDPIRCPIRVPDNLRAPDKNCRISGHHRFFLKHSSFLVVKLAGTIL